jgi:hypothetical protein
MRKALRWLAAIAGGLVLLAIVLFALARSMGPSKEQQAAVDLLADAPPPSGRNAFALLWLLPYAVQEAEWKHVLAEDARRFNRAPVPWVDGKHYAGFKSSAAGGYAAQDKAQGGLYCQWRERGCLAKIRAQPDAYAQLLAKDAALVSRADTVSAYGHVRSPFPERLDAPLPPYYLLSTPLTRHAHAFASGDVDAGLDGACRGVSASRMLIRSGDNLIGSMIGAAMLEGNTALLADMLAELPLDRPLPASCATALAPAGPDEFSACPAMRGEARLMFAVVRQNSAHAYADDAASRWLLPMLYNADKTIARMAPPLAWHCGEQARSALAADLPAKAPSPSNRSFECIDNVAGCIVADIAGPAYNGYQRRLQDAGIRLKTAATLLWLRDRPAHQSIAIRLSQRPAALRSLHRDLQLSRDWASLSVALFDPPYGKAWSLPLPASRLPDPVKPRSASPD